MRSKLIAIALVFIIFVSGCLGGSGKDRESSDQTSLSDGTSTTSGASSSILTSTTSSFHSTTSTTTGWEITSTTPAVDYTGKLLDALRGISSYLAFVNTTINSTVQIEGGGAVKVENVSVFSNSTVRYNLADNRMDMNMTVHTEPAGGRVFTRILLLGDVARVYSLGEWKEFRRGDEGFTVIEKTFESNPLSLALSASSGGECQVSTGQYYILRCTNKNAFRELIEAIVGVPKGSEVSVTMGAIEVVFYGLQPVSGKIEVGFEISTTYTDASGKSFKMLQKGKIEETFTILQKG